jgi:very-short-patch-repair endonuclease
MTEMEVYLWSRLKKLRAEGYHFRRQAPFLGYYLDFVCFSRRLVVEVDGGQHADGPQADHDFVRDKILKRKGFTVLRFWNRSVRENMDGVMHAIRTALGAET